MEFLLNSSEPHSIIDPVKRVKQITENRRKNQQHGKNKCKCLDRQSHCRAWLLRSTALRAAMALSNPSWGGRHVHEPKPSRSFPLLVRDSGAGHRPVLAEHLSQLGVVHLQGQIASVNLQFLSPPGAAAAGGRIGDIWGSGRNHMHLASCHPGGSVSTSVATPSWKLYLTTCKPCMAPPSARQSCP